METITLRYNANNDLIKSIVNSAILAGASVVKENKIETKRLSPFEESLEDIKHGRVTRIKNIDNILEELLR